jgi:hypothetical protein
MSFQLSIPHLDQFRHTCPRVWQRRSLETLSSDTPPCREVRSRTYQGRSARRRHPSRPLATQSDLLRCPAPSGRFCLLHRQCSRREIGRSISRSCKGLPWSRTRSVFEFFYFKQSPFTYQTAQAWRKRSGLRTAGRGHQVYRHSTRRWWLLSLGPIEPKLIAIT